MFRKRTYLATRPPAGAFAALTAVLAVTLAACAEPTAGPRPLGAIASSGANLDKSPAASCTDIPVKSLLATPTALVVAPGQSSSFTACTQYQSAYTVTSSNSTVATVPASVNPTPVGPDGPFAANVVVSVPASASSGATAVITVTDKKGNRQTVAVTVAPTVAQISYTGALTTYTVPVNGRYTIAATGAPGGDGWVTANPGGSGATAQGDFVLKQGTVLTVVVGGRGIGHMDNSELVGAGGGGGSFVLLAPTVAGGQPTPIVVGGGGGGATQAVGANALIDPSGIGGGGASCCGGSAGGGGSSGSGGAGGFYGYLAQGGGGGGGGLFSAGADGTGGTPGLPGGGGTYPGFAGGAHGVSQFSGGDGGFGGGGGSSGLSAGAGGGYSGGGGGGGWVGGGGGSYVSNASNATFAFVAGSSVLSLAGNSGPGNGSVTITYKGAQ